MLIEGELFYDHRKDDLLRVKVNEGKETSTLEKTGTVFHYENDKLLQIDFTDLKGIIKIKSEGKIFLPPNALIDVLNVLLFSVSDYQLNYISDSKFHVGKVIETTLSVIKISLGDKVLNFPYQSSLLAGDKVVIALKGAYLNDGIKIEKEHICLNKDLGIEENPNDILKVDDEVIIGSDFFTSH